MGSPIVFKGAYSYLLAAAGLEHKSGIRNASGNIDPTVTAFDAPVGSTYQSTLTGKVYLKTDSGSSTNWISLQTYPSQCVEVAKTGGESNTIQGAIDSVTDATASKIYCVHVHEGIYVEDVTLKAFVVLIGVANGPAAPVIQGKISCNFSTPGEFTLINRMQQQYTITGDGDRACDFTGGVLVNDFFSNVTCAADYSYDAIYMNGTTFPCILYSGRLTVTNTFDGTTKNQTGVRHLGALNVTNSLFTVDMNTKASSGVVACRVLSNTGSSPFDSSENRLTINNVRAGSTAELIGTSTTTASTGFRLSQNDQVRITGSGGGTAILSRLNSSGGSAVLFTTGLVAFIDSTFTGQVTDTATGDTQEVWLNSTNRNLIKTGAGLAIITPYDLVNTGFSQWSTVGATYWSYVPGTRVFTLEKRFTGVVLSAPVVAAAGQTVTCVDNQVNYIYADDNGVLQVTQTSSAALYTSGIPVFQLYSDGTNYRVKKENHPLFWPTSVSQFIHKMFGSALENNGGGTLSTLVAASRTVQLIGATTAVDHGLETTLPDSTGVALTWYGAYTGPSGMVWDAAVFGVTAIPSKWQNTGTTIANAANGDRIVVRCGVVLDNLNESTPQYVYSYHNAVYGNNAAAASAIAANAILDFPASLYGLEVIQTGYVTIQANGTGGGTIVAVTPAKKILGQIFTGGAASSSASLNLTDTTTFDGQLSGAETTTQVSLNRLDDYGYIPAWSATKNAAPATYRIGNPVIQNGCLYVCNTAHTASTFAADRANWTQHSIARYADVTTAEAAYANDTDLCYVASTDTFYKYVAAGSAYTRDGTFVLNTGSAGNTRRIGVAGQYVVGNMDSLSTGANKLPTGTRAQRPTATAGKTRYNSEALRLESADGSVFRAVALANDRSVTNYIKRVEFDAETGATLSSLGWSGTAAITCTRTLADLPRELTSGVGVRIGMGAGDTATYAFTLDDVDLNRVLQAVCDANVKSGTDILMTVKDGSTVLGSVTLLSGFSSPRFDFVTASNAALTLNFSSAAGGTVIISDTVVSAGKLVSGPQVSEWTAFTPSITSGGTTTTNVGWYRIVGDSLEITTQAVFSTTGAASALQIAMPSGFSIDTTKVAASDGAPVGQMVWVGTGYTEGHTFINNATSLRFVVNAASGVFLGTSLANGHLVGTRFTVPVNELSVSAYYGHEGVEFAADDGSGDVFGPNGALVPNVSLGTSATRDFVLPSNAQQSDFSILEYKLSGGNWQVAQDVFTNTVQGTTTYGIRGYWSSATVYRVSFGSGGVYANGATYGSNGNGSWASEFSSGARFRVRKASSPSLAGHNVATTGQPTGLYMAGAAPGVVGSAPQAGCIGEELIAIQNVAQNMTSSAYYTVQLALTPGVWEVSGHAFLVRNGATVSTIAAIVNIANQNANPLDAVSAYLDDFQANFSLKGVTAPTVRIRYDGTTNICTGSSNSSNGYAMLRVYPGIFTGGPMQVRYMLRAVRIA